MQKLQTKKRRKPQKSRKLGTARETKCINCPMFERHVNWGLCTKYGVEIGLVLAKKARVCKDWE